MKRYALVFLFILCGFPSLSSAEELNAGFVQGIWYSAPTVFAGTPTRIYVALRNNTPHDLTGTVRFTDNGSRIGSSPVNALSGRLVEAWVDWKPTFGEHTISASMGDAELHIIGGGTQQIDISGIIATDTLTVDYDTDSDGIGNATDTDDDNDGVSDIDEKARGTNPLVQNPKVVKVEDAPARVEKETTIAQAADVYKDVPERGFEKYLGNSAAHSALDAVTEKVGDAKQSLDTYREKRNTELYAAETSLDTTQETNTDTATITRSSVDTKNNFLSSFVSGVASLLTNVWTFILWLVSRVLSHPAFIQLLLLFGILYILYRIARRIGRRPYN